MDVRGTAQPEKDGEEPLEEQKPAHASDIAPESADPRLDFESADFDAALALSTEGLQPPVPEAPALDNVSKFRALLPLEISEEAASIVRQSSERDVSADKATKAAKHEALKARAQKAVAAAASSVPSYLSLQGIMDVVPRAESPLSLLHTWVTSGCRVCVVTRHAAGVRGKAVGVLKAFDRFMNLLMLDVEESYTVIIKVPRTKQQGPGAGAEAREGVQEAMEVDHRQQEQAGVQVKQMRLQQHLEEKERQQQQQQQQLEEGNQQQHQQQQQQQQVKGHGQPPPQQQQQKEQGQERQQQRQGGQQAAPDGCGGTGTSSSSSRGASKRALGPRVRWCKKQERRFRHMEQLMVRGDSVVMVHALPASQEPRL